MSKVITVEFDRVPSGKDIEIVELLSDGNTARDIAGIKRKPVKTISSDIEVLKRAYGCRSQVELVALFLRNGLIK